MHMETIICDITAFDCWRIPPVVQMLLAGDETDSALAKLLREEQLLLLREEMSNSPLCRLLLKPNPATRKPGSITRIIRPIVPLLAANHVGTIDVMVGQRSKCHSSSIIHPHLSSDSLPFGATSPISEYVRATSPAYTLFELSGRIGLISTLMLATELCGSFTVYKAPQPIRTALQQIARDQPFPAIGGWRPLFDSNGNLTDLWSRPALATPQDLKRISSETDSLRGAQRFRTVTELVVPGAASPFEARAGILLGLSRRRGGEGYEGFAYNKRLDLPDKAKALARRGSCICDLYWDNGLDIECQSALVHDNAASFLSDSDRTTALKHMGIDVLPITYDQIKSEKCFNALSETIARALNLRYRPKTPRQIKTSKALRSELFADWGTIHLR